MPLDLHIIRAQEFIRLSTQGQLNLEESKTALAMLAVACRKRGVDRALLDLRALPIPPKPLFTPAQLAALVGTFREAGFTREQKLAVLYRSDPHRGARLFAFIGIMRGWLVRAFGDFEEALLWLSEQNNQKSERGAQPIPIQPAKHKLEVMSGIRPSSTGAQRRKQTKDHRNKTSFRRRR